MFRDALNEALREEMRRDQTVFMMGEGIGEKGGSYKVTVGLLKEFGPKSTAMVALASFSLALTMGAVANLILGP